MNSIEFALDHVSHLPVVRRIAPVLNSRRGVTALEYGLIASLIAIVIIAGTTQLGTDLNAMFNNVAAVIKAKTPPAPV